MYTNVRHQHLKTVFKDDQNIFRGFWLFCYVCLNFFRLKETLRIPMEDPKSFPSYTKAKIRLSVDSIVREYSALKILAKKQEILQIEFDTTFVTSFTFC